MKNRENPLDIRGIFFYYIEAVRKEGNLAHSIAMNREIAQK